MLYHDWSVVSNILSGVRDQDSSLRSIRTFWAQCTRHDGIHNIFPYLKRGLKKLVTGWLLCCEKLAVQFGENTPRQNSKRKFPWYVFSCQKSIRGTDYIRWKWGLIITFLFYKPFLDQFPFFFVTFPSLIWKLRFY